MKSATLSPGEMGGTKVVLRLPWWRIVSSVLVLLLVLWVLPRSAFHKPSPDWQPTLDWPVPPVKPWQFQEGIMIVVFTVTLLEALYKITRFLCYRVVVDETGVLEETLWGSRFTPWASVASFFISDRTIDGIRSPIPTLLNAHGLAIFRLAPPVTHLSVVRLAFPAARAEKNPIAEKVIQVMRDRGIAEVPATQ